MLHNKRQHTMAGAQAIQHSEIKAFCDLTGAIIPPWELSVIDRMDNEVRAILNKTGGSKRDPAEIDVSERKEAIRGAAKTRRVVKRERKTDGTG